MKKLLVMIFVMVLNVSVTFAQSQQSEIEEANGIENTVAISEGNEGFLNEVLPIIEGSILTEKELEQNLMLLTSNPNKVTAGILAILLGDFGVQHFYTGQVVRGILDIVFCWTGIPAIIGIVEGIIWLTEDDAAWAARVAGWNSRR